MRGMWRKTDALAGNLQELLGGEGDTLNALSFRV